LIEARSAAKGPAFSIGPRENLTVRGLHHSVLKANAIMNARSAWQGWTIVLS
jgi:hypothetical protein